MNVELLVLMVFVIPRKPIILSAIPSLSFIEITLHVLQCAHIVSKQEKTGKSKRRVFCHRDFFIFQYSVTEFHQML